MAYALTWAVWVPMALAGATVRQGYGWPTHVPGLFGPLAAAVAVLALTRGRAGVADLARATVRWRVRWYWYLVALSPAALYAVAAIAMASSGQGWPDSAELGSFSGLPVVAAPLMWLLLIALAFGEECGWRGFAVARLLERHDLLTTAVVVGVLWAAWHLPSMVFIENYRQLGVAILPGFFIGVVAGSVFLAWLYPATGGNVLMVALWHGTYNLCSGTAAAHGLVAALVSAGVM